LSEGLQGRGIFGLNRILPVPQKVYPWAKAAQKVRHRGSTRG